MSETLLQVRDLSVAFRVEKSEVLAVDRVSFDVRKGETLALVGESGAGKTATALSVLQLLPYPSAHHPSGSIRLRDTELLGADERTLRGVRGDRIAMVFQEPMSSLNPLHSVERQVSETLLLHRRMRPEAARRRTLELLEMVGLREAESRLDAFPHQLSGGQRQRVMIALALANEPDLLIADEPTTALDVTVQAQILELLKRLQARMGLSMLWVTHDLGVVRKMADWVCVMREGRIVESRPAAELFRDPSHPYTRELLAAELDSRPDPPPSGTREVMGARGLRVWFPIKRGILRRTVTHVKAVEDLTLAIREGHTLGVVGESGSGKTTLALALLRLISSSGEIALLGRGIQGAQSRELRPLRREMQIVFQDPFGSLSPRLSVGQIVEEGLLVHGSAPDRETRRARITAALEEVGLDGEVQDRYPHEFSGGQRQRIAIARVMILKPRLVILDEPTSALDRSVQIQIIALLRELQRKHGLAYIFISHDLRVVRSLAHEVIVMKDGRMVEHGSADQIFSSPRTDYTRALVSASLELEAV